ncbi:MAG: shikimate kinase [Clostridiales bacterium]|nr:shikimate kinase [Clostridiales bacterium]MCF8021135.1 shikimate kinase [Clostridiales bacterium]
MKNIVLIGFMGTGKTAVGWHLANRLRRKMVDTDSNIEELTGKSILEIFKKNGSLRFRSEEKLQVKRLYGQKNLVISTGGGMVLDSENVQLLKENGVLICLTASPEVISERVKSKNKRPLLQNGKVKETVQQLLEDRAGYYDIAELTVDTGEGSINETVDKIINYLKENNYI